VKEIALDTPAGVPGKSFILRAIRHGRSRERHDQESARGDREDLIALINCGVFQTGRARSPVQRQLHEPRQRRYRPQLEIHAEALKS